MNDKPRCPVCGEKLPKPRKTGRKRLYCDKTDCKQLGSLLKKVGRKLQAG